MYHEITLPSLLIRVCWAGTNRKTILLAQNADRLKQYFQNNTRIVLARAVKKKRLAGRREGKVILENNSPAAAGQNIL
jgi:hypothetical protein